MTLRIRILLIMVQIIVTLSSWVRRPASSQQVRGLVLLQYFELGSVLGLVARWFFCTSSAQYLDQWHAKSQLFAREDIVHQVSWQVVLFGWYSFSCLCV